MNNIFPRDAQAVIESGEAGVIDVRTPDEFSGGHIPGAKNINFNDPSFAEKVNALDKDARYIVNCQMGGRSARTTALMQQLGFKDVINLEGGINAWKGAGLAIERVG